MNDIGSDLRIQSRALQSLQESVESYVVSFFDDLNRCAIHGGRSTVRLIDINLARRISGYPLVVHHEANSSTTKYGV
jgi:histone H3/H4